MHVTSHTAQYKRQKWQLRNPTSRTPYFLSSDVALILRKTSHALSSLPGVRMRFSLPIVSLFLLPLCTYTYTLQLPPPNSLTITPNISTTYPIQCIKVTDPPLPILRPASCINAIASICNQLTFPILRKTHWIWSAEPSCALGYYLPVAASRADLPSRAGCESDLFGELIEQCGMGSQFNVGRVNVKTLPSSLGPGEAVDAGKPSYLLAPGVLGGIS